MRNGPLRDRVGKAMLDKLYTDAGLSSTAIAERYGSRSATVLKLLSEYGIPRRTRGVGKT